MGVIVGVKPNEQTPIGILSLPLSQRPSPLFSFGLQIAEKGNFIVSETFYDLKFHQSNLFEAITEIFYQPEKDFSLFLLIPAVRTPPPPPPPSPPKPPSKSSLFNSSIISADITTHSMHVSTSKTASAKAKSKTRLGRVTFEAEYAYYLELQKTYSLIGTIFATVQTPGQGFATIDAASFLLGTTGGFQTFDWTGFVVTAVALPLTRFQGVKEGKVVLYNIGLAYDFANPPGWILAGQLELNGVYSRPNKKNGITVPNTGGNVVFLGPSLFASNRYLSMQAGIQFAVAQKLRGKQDRAKFQATARIAYTFF